MLRQILTILNSAPDDVIDNKYLAEDNFPFLLKADYTNLIKDFKQRFVLKKEVELELGLHDTIFMQPNSKIDMQVFDFVVADYAVSQLREIYNVSISLHNDSKNRFPNRSPSRVMVEAITVVADYILKNNLPHFLPYYQFDFHNRLPRDLVVPKGLETFLSKSRSNL